MLQVQELDDFFSLFACLEFGFTRGGGKQHVLPEIGFTLGVPANQKVVQHSGVLKQFNVLEGARNAQPSHVLRRLVGQAQLALGAHEINHTGGGRVDAADQVEHGGFASAVGADEGEYLTLFHVKTDLIDRQHAAKAHAQGLGRKKGVWVHFSRSDFWKDFCRLNIPLR